jgi:hypothetical protein
MPRACVGLVLALGLACVLPPDSQITSWGVLFLVAAALLDGLSRRLRDCVPPLLGVAFGVLAVAGFRLIPGWLVSAWSGRLDCEGCSGQLERVEFSSLLSPAPPVETFLQLGGGPVLLLGLAASAVLAMGQRDNGAEPGEGTTRASQGLAVAATTMVLLAWSSGRSGQPWEGVGLLPGLDGVRFPHRMQWILLISFPLAVAWGLRTAADHLRPWARDGLTTVLGGAVLFVALPRVGEDTWARTTEIAPLLVSEGVLRSIGPDDALASRGLERGQIQPWFPAPLEFPPLEPRRPPTDLLAWNASVS